MIIFVQKSEHAGFRNNLSQERIVHQGCPCQLHFHRRVLNLVIFLYINLEKKINSPTGLTVNGLLRSKQAARSRSICLSYQFKSIITYF